MRFSHSVSTEFSINASAIGIGKTTMICTSEITIVLVSALRKAGSPSMMILKFSRPTNGAWVIGR